MAKACDIRKGDLVGIRGIPHEVESLTISTPSARGAASLYHFRFRNLVDKNKKDVTCKGDELFEDVDFEKRLVQFLYREGDQYTFMDQEDFSQFTLSKGNIEEQIQFLVDDMEGITALKTDGQVLTIQMPQKVNLKIVQCDPVLKGASVTARGKPATLETGLVVQVPEYLEPGEVITVDTVTGTYLSRANRTQF